MIAPPPFSHVRKAPVFICWSLCLVYLKAWRPRLGVMEMMCMLRNEEPDELLVVPPVGSCPRCASVGMPQSISRGTLELVIVRVRDSESPF